MYLFIYRRIKLFSTFRDEDFVQKRLAVTRYLNDILVKQTIKTKTRATMFVDEVTSAYTYYGTSVIYKSQCSHV